MMHNLSYIYEKSRVVGFDEKNSVEVKGPKFILDTIETWQQFIELLSQKYDEFKEVNESMKYWIEYLQKNYSDPAEKSNLPVKLTFTDAQSLTEISGKWIATIIESYQKPVTAIIDQDVLNKIIPDNLINKLDNIGKEDLEEGLYVLQHGFSTSSSMILLRAAENLIQKFYKSVIGNDPVKLTWGEMLQDLEKSGKVKKSLLGYLNYLNEKRIDTAHPYRRYSQEESERILLHLKSLLEEL